MPPFSPPLFSPCFFLVLHHEQTSFALHYNTDAHIDRYLSSRTFCTPAQFCEVNHAKNLAAMAMANSELAAQHAKCDSISELARVLEMMEDTIQIAILRGKMKDLIMKMVRVFSLLLNKVISNTFTAFHL